MTSRSGTLSLRRAVEVAVSLAAILAGIFSGIAWVSAFGGAALGWVVASALLKVPASEVTSPRWRVYLALLSIILTAIFLLVILLLEVATYILLPALVVGLAAVFLVLGNLLRNLNHPE